MKDGSGDSEMNWHVWKKVGTWEIEFIVNGRPAEYEADYDISN